MEGKFDKLIDKLSKSKPALEDPGWMSNDIMSMIEKEGRSDKPDSIMRLLAKVAAVVVFILSTGLLVMQEWQASNNHVAMKEEQKEIRKYSQPITEVMDCKQLIQSSLKAVLPDVKIKVDKSNRIVEFDGEEERLDLLANYLDSDLNLSKDGKYYLTENDIKAFGITCELF